MAIKRISRAFKDISLSFEPHPVTNDLPVLKKTPKGAPSTDASVLDELSKKHEIAKYLLEYREIEKIRSTYIDGLSSDIVNGKVHSNFNLYGTSTGRLSSEKPNRFNQTQVYFPP